MPIVVHQHDYKPDLTIIKLEEVAELTLDRIAEVIEEAHATLEEAGCHELYPFNEMAIDREFLMEKIEERL